MVSKKRFPIDSIAGPATPVLEWAAPINRWDEAVPLGNGLLGGLLWGGGDHYECDLAAGETLEGAASTTGD